MERGTKRTQPWVSDDAVIPIVYTLIFFYILFV